MHGSASRISCLMLLAGVVTSVAACGSKNVLFVARPALPNPPVVSVFYDRYGDIYPGEHLGINETTLRKPRKPSDLELRLSTYYMEARTARPSEWQALLQDAGIGSIDAGMADTAAWRMVQDRLRQRVIDQANASTRDGKTLVILIHGFNNDLQGARDWYTVARDSVAHRVPNAAYLDVYWDGLMAPAVPFFIWKRAQYNFPLVGLEFRRILNQIDRRTPIRVLTHSSGGPLIASAIGDASAVLSAHDAAYAAYRLNADTMLGPYARTFPRDFRIGMIAPAMHPATFANFRGDSIGPARLIFGVNSEDYALTKMFMPCGTWGSTCLGSHPEAFCERVIPAFAGNPFVKLYLFNFAGSTLNRAPVKGFWEDHSMLRYLERDDSGPFLDLLLTDVPRADETARYCGG